METPTITLTIGKVRPADLTTAKRTVSEYREQGNGSNRTKWDRVTVLLSAVLTVVGSGRSVEVTELFTGSDGNNDQRTTDSPAYHQVHRALSHGAIRPLWDQVQVVALKDTTSTKTTVTGVSSTTGKVGRVRVFITPAG